MSHYREMGWSDGSSDSAVDLDAMKDDLQDNNVFSARRVPIVEMDQNDLNMGRQLWASCLIGFLLDERSVSPRRL